MSNLIQALTELATKNAGSIGKTVSDHFAKHGKKYLEGGAVLAGGALVYKTGETVGHKKGKKEGTIEQAKRDERKFQEMRSRHERDRAAWKKTDKEKDKLIDNLFEHFK